MNFDISKETIQNGMKIMNGFGLRLENHQNRQD